MHLELTRLVNLTCRLLVYVLDGRGPAKVVAPNWSHRTTLVIPDHLLQIQLDLDDLVPVLLTQQSPLLLLEELSTIEI